MCEYLASWPFKANGECLQRSALDELVTSGKQIQTDIDDPLVV